MNLDSIILFLLLDNYTYNKYIHLVDMNYYKINNKEIYRLLLCLKDMKDKGDTDNTVEDLMLFFFAQNPNMKEQEKAYYTVLFENLNGLEISEDVVDFYFEKYLERVKTSNILNIAVDILDGKAEYQELLDLVDTDKKPNVTDDMFVTDDLEQLYEATRAVQGLRWPLSTLNHSLGSLRPGDFGFIIARPETGKTTFVSHVATWMTEQHDGNTLWINNEEQGAKVKVRNFQSLLGLTSQELFQDIRDSNRRWQQQLGNRLRLYDDASISTRRVEQLCKELQPKLIIIDQLDKIKGVSGEGHAQLKQLYQWARELAKKYDCPVIGVSQASASGEGKFFLTMEDIDGSKTGKPGEADFIIGIGKEDNNPVSRGISLIKNKLTGDEDGEESLRHGRFAVRIIPEIARYEDL